MDTLSHSAVPSVYLDANNVSVGSRARLEALEKYDLSHLTNKFVDRGRYFSPEQIWPLRDYFGKVDLEIAGLLEKEFRRFVSLTILEPGHMYAPPGALDMYWHFFVLDTRSYASFCGSVWGDAHDHGALPKDAADVRSPAPPPILPEDDTRVLVENISLIPGDILSTLSPQVVRRIYLLEHWDLSFFTERLIKVEGGDGRRFSPEQAWPIRAHFSTTSGAIAQILEWEFKKFVILTLLNESHVLIASGSVQMYWHFLILHTKEYREFCNAIWGRFRHCPFESTEDAHAFNRTTSFYKEVFGDIDSLVWSNPDTEIPV